MSHFTDTDGFNAISAAPVWKFLAQQPPGEHPVGAYFTTLGKDEPLLAKRLRISRAKTEYVFQFVDKKDLLPLPGGRGAYIFYSPTDYLVGEDRQEYAGPTS